MKEKIIRSEGLNESESLLSKICDKTFLKLWVYPNPYKKTGEELCDLLAIFENHVFIFSVKNISFNQSIDLNIAWNRWKRSAVDSSIAQITKAENWIRRHPSQIFLDAKCKKEVPVKINSNNLKIHRIIVAHGAEDACKKHSENNNAGSMGIMYGENADIENMPNSPFIVSLPKKKVIHLLDSYNLEIVLGELDTISDLTSYFLAKESAISKYKNLIYCGEEDLVAHYFLNFDEEKKSHFIGAKDREDIDSVFIDQGDWTLFSSSEAYQRKKAADQISYLWDSLIQKTLQNALDAKLLGDGDIFNQQNALKEMAKEPRFMRRELSAAMYNSISKFPKSVTGHYRLLSSYPSYYPDKRYVFLQVSSDKIIDYEEDYRSKRQAMLEIACGVQKTKNMSLKKIIGIATEPPTHDGIKSEDFALMDCSNWSQDKTIAYTEANEGFKFFETSNMNIRLVKSQEFPQKNPINLKPGRNDPCPCGKDKKYKKCCLPFVRS